MMIIILTLFLISAVSASDVDDVVSIDNSEIQIQESDEVDQLDFEEFEVDDVVENDVVSEEELTPIYNQEYDNSYIINDLENLNEIEHFCIEVLKNEILNSNADLDFESNLFKFEDIDKFKILTHDDIIFYNDYCHILTHVVDKNIIISCDKLHTKFAFSIDNLIVGSEKAFTYAIFNPNFSNFYLLSFSTFQTFSDFVQIFMNINYFELSFFPSKTIE